MVTEKEFLKVINNKDKGPKPYDTTAEVVRVEDGVAWVHIDGGVEETPAELTINATKGDKVKVRLVGGQAYLIGNGTAPPTDDRVANTALGVANGARVTAVAAEEVAQVTEQRTRPAITSMTTWYKLSNGTPEQPTEDDHEGWSEEEPLWDADSDEQLYYSVRSRTVQGVINWTYPHVLSSYANMSILQNAILFEVGEGSSVSHIDDSNGDHILDNTGDPLIAVGGSIRDAFAYTRIEAASIRSEVAETYVDKGASQIHSLSSVMRQTAEGVDIYATINGEESDTHSHIDNDSFDIVKNDVRIGSFSADGLSIWAYDGSLLASLGYGEGASASGTAYAPFYDLGHRKANTVIGNDSVAEGYDTTASGYVSHAEGAGATASGHYSHAEGYNTTASANYTHAEGASTTASEIRAHAEGGGTTASGTSSHAEGSDTTASGNNSHAEGSDTTASGINSHASGKGTLALGAEQFVIGRYNVFDGGNYAFIVGNGTSSQSKTIFAIDWNGNIHLPAGKQVLYDL